MFRAEQNHEPKHRDGQVTVGRGSRTVAHCARMERLHEGGREPDPERPQIPGPGTWTLSSRLWGERRGCVSKSQA